MKKQYIQPALNVHVLCLESSILKISYVMGQRYDVNETPTLTEGEEWSFEGGVAEDDDDKRVD